ncbi:MAG: ectonucleotide pyrophosphatase/phosphodiesterase, partial [Acidobacteria bacterium]|nr:ectonucleotide pyrophosphatase/phosphodiesterase [Acidobacteriota bacterium]
MCLIFILLASFSKPESRPADIVVLISFDGIRWDAVENVKGFSQIEKDGFRVQKMRSVFPSMTFPAHASIATGTLPDKHGIVSSVFLEKSTQRRFNDEKEAEWMLSPPLWAFVENNKMKSAVCAWPVSQGDWKGATASFYKPYTEDLNDSEIEEWVISNLKREEKPNLIMAWFHGADYAGHKFGPKSREYKEAVERSGAIL